MKSNSLYIFAVIFIGVCMGCATLFAMPANPLPFETHQPDGKKIKLHVQGDEWFHWFEDTNGYTVVRDKAKRYAYGKLDKDGKLIPTDLTVGIDDPQKAGIKKRTLPPASIRRHLKPALISGESSSIPPSAVSSTGTMKNLVVLCMFSDHDPATKTRQSSDYDILFNQIGGDATLAPTGSVKDLYLENSYGQLTINSTVTVWVTLPHTEAYYANNEDGLGTYPQNAQGMVVDALDLVDPLIDFSQFDEDNDNYIDSIGFIHSGYGAETGGGGGDWIWSHRWALNQYLWTSSEGVRVNSYHTEPALWGTSGTNIVRFGVIAHETGHFLGLPDLYDTDGGGEGIGSWGIMANSWGFDYSQLHPPHFSAWSKIELGWLAPTVISEPGSYTINQAETNPEVYRIDNGYPSREYLLIENRQPTGIESVIPQGGLCIFHIDENADYDTEGYPGQTGWPDNGNHYKVALLQADGYYNLEKGNNRGDSGDVYHANGVSTISSSTTPNTDAYQSGNIIITNNTIENISPAGPSMTFTFDDGTVFLPPQAFDSSVITPVNSPVTITLQAVDDGYPAPAALTYTIFSLPSNGILEDNSVEITSVPYQLTGDQVTYTPYSNCRLNADFDFIVDDGGTPPEGGQSNQAKVTVDIIDDYSANMDNDPDWTFAGFNGQPGWKWGTPDGSEVDFGNPDPTSGNTGSNVIGYELSGTYSKMDRTEWASTPEINCTGIYNVMLTFYRWLNVDQPTYDHAYIEISNDGTSWNRIWENATEITDAAWTLQTYDISLFADNQPTVYIRWGMGPNNNKRHYSGWNIDDVKVFSSDPAQLTGDIDMDCYVDQSDLTLVINRWLENCGNCDGTDLNTDGKIDIKDLAELSSNWLKQL